jgi:hypothetical protein
MNFIYNGDIKSPGSFVRCFDTYKDLGQWLVRVYRIPAVSKEDMKAMAMSVIDSSGAVHCVDLRDTQGIIRGEVGYTISFPYSGKTCTVYRF